MSPRARRLQIMINRDQELDWFAANAAAKGAGGAGLYSRSTAQGHEQASVASSHDRSSSHAGHPGLPSTLRLRARNGHRHTGSFVARSRRSSVWPA